MIDLLLLSIYCREIASSTARLASLFSAASSLFQVAMATNTSTTACSLSSPGHGNHLLSATTTTPLLQRQLRHARSSASVILRSSPALPPKHSVQLVPADQLADTPGSRSLRPLRRGFLLSLGCGLLAIAGRAGEAQGAVKQGLLAGRIPGLSEPDGRGWRTYRRPDDKSGGHGVGWSPIIPYSFQVPQGWEEVPVSIADLGGTEIDLRFANSQEGRLFVIVAPVRRFADIDGDATIEQIGSPERVISAFGPEVTGENVEGKVLATETAEHEGRTYYQFEIEAPHAIITATAAGNRLYLFNVTANGLQWKRHYKDLKEIASSFRVV